MPAEGTRVVVRVVHADALTVPGDLLGLKFAQEFYGIDKVVRRLLGEAGINIDTHNLTPQGFLHFPAPPDVAQARVAFIGTNGKHNFDPNTVRQWAFRLLEAAHSLNSPISRIVMTIHGRGFGLDTQQCFEAQIDGLKAAIMDGSFPGELEDIVIAEPNYELALELERYLRQLLPTGWIQYGEPSVIHRPTKLFISYAHADAAWLQELQVHLKPLLRGGLLETWTDQQIPIGSDWRLEIEKALQKVDAGILLVTPHFLASDFIHSTEIPALLSRKLLWVPISSSNFRHTVLAKYQAIHDPSKPLDQMEEMFRNAAWVAICDKILESISIQETAPHVEIEEQLHSKAIEAFRADDVPALSRPKIREIMSTGLSRSQIAAIWYDLFEDAMDDYVKSQRPKGDCVIKLLDRASREEKFSLLERILIDKYPQLIASV